MTCSHQLWDKNTCYFCKNTPWKETKLADGCMVPACVVCIKTLQLSISLPTTSSGEIGKGEKYMANIDKAPESSGNGLPYLGKKTYQGENIRHIKIATEAVLVDTEYEGKPTGQKPQCEVDSDSEKCPRLIWQMNKKTRNYMVEKFGSDTSKWVGKEFDIKLARAGNANPSIYPKDLSLEEIIE